MSFIGVLLALTQGTNAVFHCTPAPYPLTAVLLSQLVRCPIPMPCPRADDTPCSFAANFVATRCETLCDAAALVAAVCNGTAPRHRPLVAWVPTIWDVVLQVVGAACAALMVVHAFHAVARG